MGLVTTISTFYGQQCKLRVNVDSHGKFTCKLPSWTHAALGKTVIEGRTLEAIESEISRTRTEYANLQKRTRRVILYKFELQDKGHRYEDNARDDLSFGIGKGIQVAVVNAVETQHLKPDGSVSRESYEAEDEQPYPDAYNYGQFGCLTNSSSSDPKVLEWSEAREAWFVRLCVGLDHLIESVKALDSDEQLLLSAIANNRLLGVNSASNKD